MNFRSTPHRCAIVLQLLVALQLSGICSALLELAPGEENVGEIYLGNGAINDTFYIKIFADTNVENFGLIPDTAQEMHMNLGVECSGRWYIEAEDTNIETSGYLTSSSGGEYHTSQHLENPLKVSAEYDEVTLPEGGIILAGNPTFTEEDKILLKVVTFKQTVTWNDEYLPAPNNYSIEVSFRGSAAGF